MPSPLEEASVSPPDETPAENETLDEAAIVAERPAVTEAAESYADAQLEAEANADAEPGDPDAESASPGPSASPAVGQDEAGDAGAADDASEVIASITEAQLVVVGDGPEDAPSAALVLRDVRKAFGELQALEGITLEVPAGSFYGLVGPNGAGKTTTLSIIAGLLRPDAGEIVVGGVDATRHPLAAKRLMGVPPDRFRTFDRLTGRQLLYYYGTLRGLPSAEVERRAADLARAFDLTESLGRVVSDYSAGMAKKIMLAGALIHSPRVLVLDEPFEAVDPVSSAVILDILSAYVAHGGTVILSSHGMELVERVCSRVAVIVAGSLVAEGPVDEVRGEVSLEERFVELVGGGGSELEGLEWLHTFSD